MASPSLFRGLPRKSLAGVNPQLVELQKRIGGMLTAPVDYSQQMADIGKQRVALAGKAPTAFSLEALKNQGALVQARKRGEFYQQNQVPQMQATPNPPLPTREEVPLPDRGNNRNEVAARFGASIAGLFNPNVDSSQVIAGGQRKDELAYQQARDNYSLALQKADQKYRDEAFAREQAMNAESQRNQIDYSNAMARYGQAEQANTAQANIAGLEGQGQGLSTLDTQTRDYNTGMAQFEADLATLEAKSKTNREAWETYGKVSDLLQKAQELEIQGSLAESKIAADQAVVEVHKATAQNVANETAQAKALFPGRQKEQGLRNQALSSSLQTDALQRGLLGAQIGETKARTNKLNTEARMDVVGGKAANFTAYSNNIKAQLEGPYQVYQAAQKEFDDATKAHKELWAQIRTARAKGEIKDARAVEVEQMLSQSSAELAAVGQRRDQALQNYSSLYTQGQQALRNALSQSPLSRESKVTGRTQTPKAPPKGLTGKPIQILGVR